jgi:hypothetical protein
VLLPRDVARAWWPLAMSWMFMSFELPALSAVVARLPEPSVHLAAYGGVVFPIALIIESPIIMLLAASTALCVDEPSYRKVWRFMHRAGALLTALHLLVACTPLYDVVLDLALDAPPEVVEPARLGLLIMTPWTWSIAYRRFHQGLLIRFGRSRIVGFGTGVRLAANAVALAVCWFAQAPGIVTATAAVAAGVVAEALWIGWWVRPVVRGPLAERPHGPGLTSRGFARFYIPLALTSLLYLAVQPLGSAAMGRMPAALASLAAWPVLHGLLFFSESFGIAFQEVVVALAGRPGATAVLRRFGVWLAILTTGSLLFLAATPLALVWFRDVSGLEFDLAKLAATALWLAVPMPALVVAQSLTQGLLVHGHRTAGVTEAVACFLVVSSTVLAAGVQLARAPGLVVAVGAFTCGAVVQTAWLVWRSRDRLRGGHHSMSDGT